MSHKLLILFEIHFGLWSNFFDNKVLHDRVWLLFLGIWLLILRHLLVDVGNEQAYCKKNKDSNHNFNSNLSLFFDCEDYLAFFLCFCFDFRLSETDTECFEDIVDALLFRSQVLCLLLCFIVFPILCFLKTFLHPVIVCCLPVVNRSRNSSWYISWYGSWYSSWYRCWYRRWWRCRSRPNSNLGARLKIQHVLMVWLSTCIPCCGLSRDYTLF